MSVTDDKSTPASFSTEDARRAIELARQTLQIEADAILALKNRLSDDSSEPLARAVHLLLGCKGRAVVSGIGKSGHIGRKIA
ncbi:MAG TPA: KpsF/GutQ family sugar-phosphate isomerase, partial [Stenotrophomonas sp.]|nr:KpsF/GutQ family sugar-phosphate isomerase [Stenotrophomonas sp.]